MSFARRVRFVVRRRMGPPSAPKQIDTSLAAPEPQSSVRCVYAAALDGDALWLALELPVAVRNPVVRLRSRATDEHLDLPSQLTEGRRLEVCSPVVGLDAPWEVTEDIYDVELVADSNFRARISVRDSVMAPKTPTTTPPSSDHKWHVLPYRTRNGWLSVRFSKVATGAEAREVRSDSTSLTLQGFLFGASLASRAEISVSEVILRRRHDSHELTFACTGDSRRFAAEIDPEIIYAAAGPSTAEVWNVYVAVESTRLRIGRRTTDIERVQTAIRYPTARYSSSDGGVLKLRPYYSNGRFLALETHAERADTDVHTSLGVSDMLRGAPQ